MTDFIDSSTGEVIPGTEDNIIVAFAVYQQAAAKHGWIQHRFLNDPQRKAIKARLAEGGGMEAWREALDIAGKSDFLCGKIASSGKPRFKMDLNFFTRPSAFSKILDGFYSRDQGPTTTSKLILPTMQPPHLKPAPAFVPDSIEVRELGMIESYTRYGRYADANRIVEQRAKRLGIPAVLVPDPSIAWTSASSKPATAAPRAPAQTVTDIPWTDEDVPMSAYHEAEA